LNADSQRRQWSWVFKYRLDFGSHSLLRFGVAAATTISK
jgi:hypothetical protein